MFPISPVLKKKQPSASAPTPSDVGRQVVEQLDRLNSNFERYLSHIGAKVLPTAEEQNLVAGVSLFVGQPASELEMALREHAELLGQTLEADDES